MTEGPERIRVLHVEDEPGFADLTATLLEKEDERLDIRKANDPDEGLSLLADQPIDCIVSDYDMPEQNGIEFLETVREEYPNLPFILYTGKGSEEVASDAISAGVTDYLQKAGDRSQYTLLANRVVNAVERYRIERDAEQTRRQLEAISENSTDAIVIIDTDNRIQYANPAVEAHFGYEPSTLQGKSLTEILPDRYHESHLAEIHRYLETNERSVNLSNVEFPGKHRDGTEVPLSISFGEFRQEGDRRFIGIMRDISERTRLETQLREREERFRQLAENIQEVVWMSDPEKEEMIYANPAYEDIWGQSVESLYENPTAFLDAIHPEDRDEVEAALDRQDVGTYDEEYRIIRPDGEHRWIRDRAVPIENDAGEVYRIVEIATDITEQKEKTHRLETLISNLPGVVYRTRNAPGWPMEFVRGECESLTGYSAERIENGDISWGEDIIHPADREDTWEIVQDALDDERRFELTYRIRTAGGETKWVWERGRKVDSGVGDETFLEGFIADITDSKRQERKLRREQAFTQQSLDVLQDIFYVVSVDRELLRWNEQLSTVTGYTEDEIAEMTPTDFVPEDQQEKIAETIQETLETGTSTVQAELLTKDGERIPHELTGTRLTDENGDILGFAGVGRDIRDFRKREQRLERQNEQLEQFASLVSHDLRNPLNMAMTRLELVEDDCESPHLDYVERAHNRMERLIEDVLWLARKGQGIGSTKPVPLSDQVEIAWTIATGENGADKLVIEDDLGTIAADPDRLSQLLENLFRNSVEHGSTGSRAEPDDSVEHGSTSNRTASDDTTDKADGITVTVGQLDDGFYVADDGSGIPEGNREAVFEPGYSTSREGTGFGLKIVQEVADAHGWDLRVTESADGGARFEITEVEIITS